MNLRNFQTQLNDAAVRRDNKYDSDPDVIILSASGEVELEVMHIFVSELDGKICIRLREEVRPLGRAS